MATRHAFKRRNLLPEKADFMTVAAHLLPVAREKAAESKTILEDLRVLAVDQTASTDKTQPVVVRAD